MKLKYILPIAIATAAMALTTGANAQTATIDFNTADTANPPVTNVVSLDANDNNGAVANFTLNGGATLFTNVALADNTNTATGWSLSAVVAGATANPGFGRAGGGGNYNGTVAPLAAAAFPLASGNTSHTYTGLYVQNAATVTLTISGLTAGGQYNLLSFVGRNAANQLKTGTSTFAITTGVTSFNASDSFFQASDGTLTNNTGQGVNPTSSGGNSALAVGFNNVTASSGGQISFAVTANGANVADLQGLQVQAIPEPSTVVLAMIFGIGMLFFFRRRRIA